MKINAKNVMLIANLAVRLIKMIALLVIVHLL